MNPIIETNLYIGSTSPALAWRTGRKAESVDKIRIKWSWAIWFSEAKSQTRWRRWWSNLLQNQWQAMEEVRAEEWEAEFHRNSERERRERTESSWVGLGARDEGVGVSGEERGRVVIVAYGGGGDQNLVRVWSQSRFTRRRVDVLMLGPLHSFCKFDLILISFLLFYLFFYLSHGIKYSN